MKRSSILSLAVGVAALAIATLPGRRAAADNETNDVQITIQAPLDAVDCTTTPPTIAVLGLTIDVSTATIDVQNGGGDGGDGSGDGGGSGDGSGDGGGSSQSGCAALVAGESVEVQLASDSTPLAATAVKQDGGDEQDTKVEGPIQGVDTTAQTITVLGLIIDVSGANLGGADDDSSDGNSQPIDLTQLIAGQFVEVQLASSTAPFAATDLELKNFTNQVTVEVDGSNGQPIDDADANGNPVDDVQVDVTETVPVQSPTPGAASTTRRMIRRLQFHASTSGSLTLSGLPTGRASITVTRGHAHVRRSVLVRGNTTGFTRVRLRSTGR